MINVVNGQTENVDNQAEGFKLDPERVKEWIKKNPEKMQEITSEVLKNAFMIELAKLGINEEDLYKGFLGLISYFNKMNDLEFKSYQKEPSDVMIILQTYLKSMKFYHGEINGLFSESFLNNISYYMNYIAPIELQKPYKLGKMYGMYNPKEYSRFKDILISPQTERLFNKARDMSQNYLYIKASDKEGVICFDRIGLDNGIAHKYIDTSDKDRESKAQKILEAYINGDQGAHLVKSIHGGYERGN